MQLPVMNIMGEAVDTAEVSDAVFGVPLNGALVHQSLVMYELNKRQGTHSTKTRAQVSGGGRKPWPQKYTGRARQGSIRSPQWRHGGIAFGPHPRDHRRDLPKRMRRLALRCVLSEKVRLNKFVLVDNLSLDAPSTKKMTEILRHLGIASSALIVTSQPEENVVLSSRNLSKVWTLPVSLINSENLLKREMVVMTLDAVRKAEGLWAVERAGRRSRRTASMARNNGPEEVSETGEAVHEST